MVDQLGLPKIAWKSDSEREMKRKYIPVEETAERWFQNPDFVAAYDALEEEFALASALIKAQSDADMTQEEVAKASGRRAPRKRSDAPVDADTQAVCRRDAHAAQDQF